ncbi:MAG TPA: hypothetical protein VF771_09990 [Longimicrobiaceae bacterium]
MRKLNLNVEEIDVDSFVADEYEDVRGTVLGNDDDARPTELHCGGTVVAADLGDDDCTSGCVCCRFRPAPKPQI